MMELSENTEPDNQGVSATEELGAAEELQMDGVLSESRVATQDSDSRGTMTPLMLAPGTELAGNSFRYRLVRKLGHGGFGSVYLAETLNGIGDMPAQVVLKFYHVPRTGDQKNLFRREVSSLLALQHDRIIKLYDWKFSRNSCFLVLEYYPAGSLLDTEYFLGQPIDEDGLTSVLEDLLSALNAAHCASILHLDIKPANVLRDAAGGYVLTDFGISQGSLVSHYMLETGIGSPGYQAPEQRECNRRWIGPRTDLFGVGATAWSLYTGMRLDQHPELLKPFPSVAGSALPPISSYRSCPPPLEDFIARITALDPAERPGGAAEAIALLKSSSRTKSRIRSEIARLYQTGHPLVSQVVDNLVDPLWASICSAPRPKLNYLLFKEGEVLGCEGEHAYNTYVLLSGTVRVELGCGRRVAESREGTFLGEIATLTGLPRTANLIAESNVWTLVFNAAEFEQFVVAYPAVAIRLIKTLATRCRENTGFP
jgi:serine/threonine protein kinase